jgi:hypothetical protein
MHYSISELACLNNKISALCNCAIMRRPVLAAPPDPLAALNREEAVHT